MEQLTRSSNVAYPVERSIMEENNEKTAAPAKEADIKEEEKKRALRRRVSDEDKRKIQEQYEEQNRRRRARGEEIDEKELEEQKKAIESGRPLIAGGAGDGLFEFFDIAKFEGNDVLKELAIRLRDAGLENKVTDQSLEDIRREVYAKIGIGSITEDEGKIFISEIVKKIIEQRNSQNKQENGLGGQAGDQHFENFPAHLFAGTPLEAIANEIVQAGKTTKRVPDTTVDSWERRVQDIYGRGQIDAALFELFGREMGGVLRERRDDEASPAGRNGGRREGAERPENTPRSIQDVCRWIIRKEGDQWGTGGVNELLDEGGNFKQANFLKWVRERMLFWNGFDPDNPQLNLLGSVGIETEFRTIGIGTMITNVKQYFRDEKKIDEKTGRNVIYEDLADHIVAEAFLFNTSRNYDAEYRYVMWKDQDISELIDKQYQRSIFTNSDNLKRILSLSEEYGKEGDTKVGDSIRKAFEIYYNISDFEELEKILEGGGEGFLRRETFEDALRVVLKKPGNFPAGDLPEAYKELFGKLFDKSGNAVKKEFISYINLFNIPGKDSTAVNLVREAVRLTVSRMYGLESGLDDSIEERGLKRKNLEYAETWAYSMLRWSGAAARNDTTAIGYDAFTKVQRFQQYRIRQSKATRGGKFGNEYDLPPIKRMTLDFFSGVFVEKPVGEKQNYTPLEIFKELDAVDKQILQLRGNRKEEELPDEVKLKIKELRKFKDDEWFSKLRFRQFAQLDYAANHAARGYKAFHSMLGAEELRIDEISKYEPFRGYVIDRAKFEEDLKENFMKPIRYAFQTYTDIDYSKKIRVQVNAGKDEERPIYEEMTYAEAMFGPEVLQDYYKRDRRGRIEKREVKRADGKTVKKPVIDEEKLASIKGRRLLYKRVIRAILAGRIKSHRDRFSGYAKMDYEQIQQFYKALRSIREIDLAEGDEKTKIDATRYFFTKKDIEWMRKYSGTETWKMAIMDISPGATWGATKGFGKAFKDWFQEIFQ